MSKTVSKFAFTAGLVLAMAFTSVSAEVSNTDIPLNTNQRISVYLHPVTLISSLGSAASEDKSMFMLNLTGEFPFNERYALIVYPSLLYIEDTTAMDYVKSFGIGSGIGIRRFVSANADADGFYLQLIPSIFYYEDTQYWKWKDWKDEYEDRTYNASALNVDVLGYIGYSIKYSKISLFFDIGIGYGFTHYLSRSGDYYSNDPFSSEEKILKVGDQNGLSIDINIGVGIPLL